MDACIIGWGTIGKATAEAFGIKKYYSRSQHNITLEEVSKCKYIFICMPTPTIDGKVFTQDIYEFIGKITAFPKTNDRVFIIRSTVYPGFNSYVCDSLGISNVISNPEFLSENTAIEDATHPDLIVIGADDIKYAEQVKGLYNGRFKYTVPIVTNSVTAELIKYSLNTFFATKVIYANEIFDYAQTIGANYETVKKILENHKWGSKNHFTIWYKGNRGLHGKCLPKDTQAFGNLTNSPLFKLYTIINERINKNDK